MDCHFLLQEISTQGSNPHLLWLLHWQMCSLPLSHLGRAPQMLTRALCAWPGSAIDVLHWRWSDGKPAFMLRNTYMSDFVYIYFMGLFRSPEKTPTSCVWLLASQNPGGLEGCCGPLTYWNQVVWSRR